MPQRPLLSALVAGLLVSMSATVCTAADADLPTLIKTIRSVGPKGKNHRQASQAWMQLARADADRLTEILAGMNGAGPLEGNWLRAAVDAIAERHVAGGGRLPQRALEKFTLDTKNSPRPRRLAYEWIARVDKTASQRLIPRMLNDPSVELRRDAVGQLIERGTKLLEANDKTAAIAVFQSAFAAARDIDQIDTCVEQLRKLGQQVDLPAHFGFLMHWKLVSSFDNKDKKGFNVSYPPEEKVDLSVDYDTPLGTGRWFDHATSDDYGVVDLTKAIGKHKGSIAYAMAEFDAAEGRPVELRLGCINANKLWLNGELLTANEVYHASTAIDQYRVRGELKQGRNVILLKICQNEQTESWAQRWQFQLRVCDPVGTAILSTTRPPTPRGPKEEKTSQ